MHREKRLSRSLASRPRRRGAMLILIAAAMVVFMACVVFSVDVAYMHLARTQLRSATDAAARAAGEALSRTQDLNQARQAAKDVAAANLVAGKPLILGDEDIVFGNSRVASGSAWTFTAGGTPTNSARVYGRRTRDSASGSISTLFGRVFGVFDFQPQQQSVVTRLDRDVCVVVDRSGSMQGGRWTALVQAVLAFDQEISGTPQIEQVGLVSYASDSRVDQTMTTDVSQIDSELQNIWVNGLTNIEAGLQTGTTMLTDPNQTRPYAAKTMILMTDGNVTAGGSPVPAAQAAAGQGIVIHTITFGADADRALMSQVAQATGGKHYHAPDAATLQAVFREIALTLPVVLTQ
jgi:Flp pilus assembly protein TadG/uncharacterized protein YegL